MMKARSLVQKLMLSAGVAGAMIAAGSLAYSPAARAEYPERTPGTFECRNNLDPQCNQPARQIESESWRSRNNPGPEYSEPPRISGELAPGDRLCLHNQNTPACNNPIRYTVADPETWPSYFRESSNSTDEQGN